jgi:HAD superfamily hydrolase (TIGR01509 family)
MGYRGVIFDCDGVIVDSEYWFMSSCRKYLQSLGINPQEELLATLPGKPVQAITKDMRTLFGLKNQTDEQIEQGMYSYYHEIVKSDYHEPMPGLVTFLEGIIRKGYRTALATSGDTSHVEDIVKITGLKHHFDAIVVISDVEHGKPDPEIFLTAAQRLSPFGIRSQELVIIEDSPNGIQAAKASGIFTIGLKASRIQQDTSHADLECKTYDDVMKYLESEEQK